MKNLDSLRESLENALTSRGIIVDDLFTEKRGKYLFLTVVLDKIGGIDLDGIVDATHIINKIVDKYDVSDESFILDVISKERGN